MRIAINGFGRIGRQAFRVAMARADVEVARINDLVDAETLAYLLKHDTTYGRYPRPVETGKGELRVDGQSIPVSNARTPAELPHGEDGVDVVIEATGVFRKREDAEQHLQGGAKRVLITAPAKTPVDGDFIIGVNEERYDPERHRIVTIGSCTTNCVAPMAKVLHEAWGIEHGLMITAHAYTAGQHLLDAPAKSWVRGRAAAENIVPTTTGAAQMVGTIIPELEGKLDGMAMRVPVKCGSIAALTCRVREAATTQGVHEAFDHAAHNRMHGIVAIEQAPLVSSDIIGDTHSCVVIPEQTQVMDGRLVQVMGWYDNEWAFSERLVDMAQRMMQPAGVTAAAA